MSLWGFLLCLVSSLIFVFVSLNKLKCIKFFLSDPEINTSSNIRWKKVKIILLIPVYHEEKIIKETVKFFNKIEDVEVYYVTTDKEGNKKSWKNETFNLLSQYVSKKYIINYPKKKGNKADQLNFAIKNLLNIYNEEYIYFWIFDADSRPDTKVFKYICQDKNSEFIYQMLSVYNTNFSQVSNICKSNAVLQTRWSFRFEYNNLLKNFKSWSMQNLMYLIWHWIFIRSDFIRYNLFPIDSITEDISYWYRVCLKRIFAKPIPYFYDYCSVPNKIKDNIKQISRRFYGEFELIIKYIFYNSDYKKFYYKRLFELILRWYWWIFVLIIFVISLVNNDMISLSLIFLWLIIEYISFLYVYKKITYNNKWVIKVYIYSIIKNVLDAVPLSISIFSIIYNHLTHQEQVFLKTKR